MVIFRDYPGGMFVLEKPSCGMDGRTGPPLLNLWSSVLRKGDYSRGYSELGARTYKRHISLQEKKELFGGYSLLLGSLDGWWTHRVRGWGSLSFLSLATRTQCDSERVFRCHDSGPRALLLLSLQFSLVLRCIGNYGQGAGTATRGRPGVCGLRMKGVLFP